jgi:hypothetical protein
LSGLLVSLAYLSAAAGIREWSAKIKIKAVGVGIFDTHNFDW